MFTRIRSITEMKRFITVLAFCFSLLLVLSFVLFPPVEAKEDVLMKLLDLPAPPPPNPMAKYTRTYAGTDYNKRTPPPNDDAPIEEVLDYWKHENESFSKLRYSPPVSEQTRERLMREIEKDPKLLPDYLNVFNGDRKGTDFVKGIYDREMAGGTFDHDGRASIRHWLTYNSPYYSNDLARLAQQVTDTPDYVTNQDELLALARVDFDRASPVINRFYNDPSPKASRVLALWALYRHALDTGSASDIEKYRGELKAAVAEKGLPGPTRDLAMDALVSEKE